MVNRLSTSVLRYLDVNPVWTEEVNPERWFISLALAVTRVPPNLRPAVSPSCEARFNTCVSVAAPMVTTPCAFCVTTLLLADWPNVTPLKEDNIAPVTVVPFIVKFPDAVILVPEIAEAVTLATWRLPVVDKELFENPITLLLAVITLLFNVNPPNNAFEPILKVPVVLRCSSDKLIVPVEDVNDPLLNVKSAISEPAAAVTVPVIVAFPLIEIELPEISPAAKSPVVSRSSLPKSISPEADVIEPVAKVISPITDPVAAVTFPVVLKSFELNEIPFSPEDTIKPSEIVISPNEPLVVADTVVPAVIPAVAPTEPAVKLPLVPRVLVPKLIPPVLELIVPFPKVTLPNLEEFAPVIVPVADIFPFTLVAPTERVPVVKILLAPNVIPGLADDIEPLANVISANFELIGAYIVPATTRFPFISEAPPILRVPVVNTLLSPNDNALFIAVVLISPSLIDISPIAALEATLNSEPVEILPVATRVAVEVSPVTPNKLALILPVEL